MPWTCGIFHSSLVLPYVNGPLPGYEDLFWCRPIFICSRELAHMIPNSDKFNALDAVFRLVITFLPRQEKWNLLLATLLIQSIPLYRGIWALWSYASLQGTWLRVILSNVQSFASFYKWFVKTLTWFTRLYFGHSIALGFNFDTWVNFFKAILF